MYKRTRGHAPLKKKTIPEPNRNKIPVSDDQTMYDSPSDEEPEVGPNKWNEQRLTVAFKPDHLVGRQKEKKKITQFIDGCLMKEINNRCLYISGCPGLGKTATTMQIISNISKTVTPTKARFHYINCLSLKQPQNIYKQLLLQAKKQIQSKRKTPHELALEFDSFLNKTKVHFFFVIDEVDFLYTKNENVLYNLVEWASQGSDKFSILIIANTMDFPQKLAPKILSRMGSWRMCFKPYSADEIKAIIEERLQGTSFFEPKAISFAVKKFSVYTSDLRKIFSVLKQVIQSRKGPKVTIEQLSNVWGRIVEQEDLSYKEVLPDTFSLVLQLVKKEGGKMHSCQIYNLLSQKKFRYQEVEMLLVDLKEMGLVKLNEKTRNGVRGFEVSVVMK